MKMNFEHFQIQKWTLYVGKSRWKNGVICLVSMLPSWVMVLKWSKNCIFRDFVLTSTRNLSRLKQFTCMPQKGLVTHFQKLMLFIMLWLTASMVWVFEFKEFLRNICWFNIFFDILIANISWTVAQTSINRSIFSKNVMRTFRCIYVNCFNRLRSAQNCKKIYTFLDNLQTMTQTGNMETRQMTPIFHLLFQL